MPLIRCDVVAATADGLPADSVTNTVYHTIADNIFDPSVDYDNQAQQVMDCFTGNAAGYAAANPYVNLNVTVIAYDMADAQPRPERSKKTYAPTGGASNTSDLQPPQVALCMSYYGARNLPSERGRLYLGAFHANQPSRPTAGMMTMATTLGHALFDVGGENVAWVVRSEKKNTTEPITTIWCDDSWDTQRRRKLKATTRQVLKP